MRDSLLGLFQGTLVGAVVGAAIAEGGEPGLNQPARSLARADAIVASGEAIARSGHLDRPDIPLAQTPFCLESVAACVPLMLWFHDDRDRLRDSLLHVAEIGQFPVDLRADLLGVGFAIARMLSAQFNPAQIVPQLIDDLEGIENCSAIDRLLAIQSLLADGATLEAAQLHLGGLRHSRVGTAIALAWYCFLTTPEDVSLTVRRARQTGDRAPLSGLIAGGLSGAYNGCIGIPLGWRSALPPETSDRLLSLATQLWAAWSGVCDFDRAGQLDEIPAVAAPRAIRSQ